MGRLNEMRFGGMYMECTRLFSSWWVLFIFPYSLTLIEFFTFEFRQKFLMLTEKSKNGFSFILSICLCFVCTLMFFLMVSFDTSFAFNNVYQKCLSSFRLLGQWFRQKFVFDNEQSFR